MNTFRRTAHAAFLCAVLLLTRSAPMPQPPVLASPDYGDAFWKTWGDGRAELAGYDLTFPRYGELRHGVAVAIFVTEPFSKSLRVKADPGKHPKSDEFQVMKLNLVRDFPTGIYDYNLMTSTFVGLEPFDGFAPGNVAKISFSSQEWCGNVYSQLLFRSEGIQQTLHSYFDGEADSTTTHAVKTNGIDEDSLLLVARRLAAPALRHGESIEVPILTSLLRSRLLHHPIEWTNAKLSLSDGGSVTVPAGTFAVERFVATVGTARTWSIDVEKNEPHRVVRWSVSDGETGELLASDRLPYWKMNAGQFRSTVSKLGLTPRPPRTP